MHDHKMYVIKDVVIIKRVSQKCTGIIESD